MLILDEPDNHLDIETKEVIEQSLREYKGTLFLISHDRYFVESIEPTSILYLNNGKISNL
jgi:ATP-binding cassette subfamily F protein 3